MLVKDDWHLQLGVAVESTYTQAAAEVTTPKNHFRVRENNGCAAAEKGQPYLCRATGCRCAAGYRPGPYTGKPRPTGVAPGTWLPGPSEAPNRRTWLPEVWVRHPNRRCPFRRQRGCTGRQ